MFSAGVTRDAVASACICLAGFAPEHEEDRVRALLDPLFLPARTSYGRDLDAALASVSGPGPGLVIVAGTGSVAYGRNASGDTHRAGGWGYLVGDEGSSYWIGCQALRLTLRAHDGRAPWSPLYEQVMIRSGSQSPVELDKRVYRENWKPSQIADYARLVVEFAHAGDPAALNLINQAASELSELATAVVRRLGLVNEPCGVVGGLWQAGHTLREPFEAVFHRTAPGMQVSEPLISPEEGAALLAMAAAG
jgi:N-acetylglucosamine kinase-like BadF-type ATPase